MSMELPPDDPAGREKLLTVMGQISKMLTENDMCASVVLALPGQAEVNMHLGASWSVARLEDDERGIGIRIRSKKADYTDQAERTRNLEATLGMLQSIGECLGGHALVMLEATRSAGEIVGAEHTSLTKVHKQ